MAKRILIIDDERDMRVYLGTLFKRAGYETAVAESGEDGLRLVETFRPDLITLDILMPRGSGITAYQSIRGAARSRHLPIIVLTGLTDHAEFLREIGGLPPPHGIVEKPIDREAFLRQVEEILGARG